MNEITVQNWYKDLVEDCHNIITEAVFQSRWALVEGYHSLGQRIISEHESFERANIYGEKIVQGLAESLSMSPRMIWYAVQFAKKYPDLNNIPEGKNITWNKIITKYLTTSKKITQQVEYLKCPDCNTEFQCPNCGRKIKKGEA